MKANHGEHGGHGDERGKGFMEDSFGISSEQFLPRVPRAPRGSFAQPKTGGTHAAWLVIRVSTPPVDRLSSPVAPGSSKPRSLRASGSSLSIRTSAGRSR